VLALGLAHHAPARVFHSAARVTLLTGGFSFVEGPAVDSNGNVCFTDVADNTIWRWSTSNTLEAVRHASGGANGLYFGADDTLYICEGGARRVAQLTPGGRYTPIVSHYRGTRFNSPNDLWLDACGGIYFTDPRYGSRDDVRLPFNVYYVAPAATQALAVATDLVMPNGIIGTPDGTRLYIADLGAGTTYVYHIGADGTLTNKRVFAAQGSDGMTLDNDGNVYLTGGTRGYLYYVTVYDAEGRRIDRIGVPEDPSNVTFAGRDKRTLIITARTSLYGVRLATLEEQRRRIAQFRPYERPSQPIGTGRGIFPGRVAWVHDPAAACWDGSDTRAWWWSNSIDHAAVTRMLADGVRELTGARDTRAAWRRLFLYHNATRRGLRRGYAPGERIVIKANFVNSMQSYDTPGGHVSVGPQVLYGLLQQLVEYASVVPSNITVFDSITLVDDHVIGYCTGAFPHVRFADKRGEFGRERAVADPGAPICFAAARGRVSYLPRCVSEASYMINLALLKTHQIGGMTVCAKNHFGSFCDIPAFLHHAIDAYEPPRQKATPLVEFTGHPHLGGKTILYMIDAIYGGEGWEGWIRAWRMPPFIGHWPSSIFFSQDGVAIDSVAFDFLGTEFGIPQDADAYLHEAALAHKPPSGTIYDPDGSGRGLGSLGVHEHWNNARDKQYSRNLGRKTGIELLYVRPGVTNAAAAGQVSAR